MKYAGRIIITFAIVMLLFFSQSSHSATVTACDANSAYSYMALGYVLTNHYEVSEHQCASGVKYQLETPYNGLKVCSLFYTGAPAAGNSVTTLPPGWYVRRTDTAANTRCEGVGGDKLQYTITNNPASGSWICSLQEAIPNNYVITADNPDRADYTMDHCTGSENFRSPKKIAIPSSTQKTYVCYDNSFPRPIPDNFIVSQVTPNLSLSAGDDCVNGFYHVKKPTADDYACVVPEFDVIPSGYGVIAEYANASVCDGKKRLRISTNFPEGGVVCSTNGLPANKVVTSVLDSYSYCTNKGYQIRTVSDGLSICSYDGKGYGVVPPGYVVTNIDNTSLSCGNNSSKYTVRLVNNTSYYCMNNMTQALDYLPPGYGITDFNYRSGCRFSDTSSAKNSIEFSTFSAGNTYCNNGQSLNQSYPRKVESIPENLVVTRTYTDSTCQKMVLSNPSNTEENAICSANFPPNYLWVEGYPTATYPLCEGGNGYLITKAINDSYWVCKGSPNLPQTELTGYATTRSKATDRCGTDISATAYELKKITGDGPISICNHNEIPEGYIVTEVYENSDCANMVIGSDRSVVIQKPASINGSIVQCLSYNSDTVDVSQYSQQIPEGYVPIRTNKYSQCHATPGESGDGFMIAKPSENSTTVVCNIPGIVLPAGYLPDGNFFDHSECGSYQAMRIQPEISIPDDFINSPADVLPSSPPIIQFDCTSGTNTSLVTDATGNMTGCQQTMPIH